MTKRELSKSLHAEMKECKDCIKHRTGTVSIICPFHKEKIRRENNYNL